MSTNHFTTQRLTERLLTTPIGRRLPPRQWLILLAIVAWVASGALVGALANAWRQLPATAHAPAYIVVTATPLPPTRAVPTTAPAPTPQPAAAPATAVPPVEAAGAGVSVMSAPGDAPQVFERPSDKPGPALSWHPPLVYPADAPDDAGCGGPDTTPPLCH